MSGLVAVCLVAALAINDLFLTVIWLDISKMERSIKELNSRMSLLPLGDKGTDCHNDLSHSDSGQQDVVVPR